MAAKMGRFVTTIAKTYTLDYLLYLPRGYRPEGRKAYPLVLFLHGMGERGQDLELVKKHGISQLTAFQREYGYILLAPQCPLDSWWVGQVDALIALLDEIMATYRIDPARVYLTGLSMGGYGAWHLATAQPERFAAVVPICGGGSHWYGFPEKVAVLKDTPVWVFHGADDDIVPLSESQQLVDVLEACGGNVRFTVYPKTEHDSWTQTYSDPELYGWLLQQTRPAEPVA